MSVFVVNISLIGGTEGGVVYVAELDVVFAGASGDNVVSVIEVGAADDVVSVTVGNVIIVWVRVDDVVSTNVVYDSIERFVAENLMSVIVLGVLAF